MRKISVAFLAIEITVEKKTIRNELFAFADIRFVKKDKVKPSAENK